MSFSSISGYYNKKPISSFNISSETAEFDINFSDEFLFEKVCDQNFIKERISFFEDSAKALENCLERIESNRESSEEIFQDLFSGLMPLVGCYIAKVVWTVHGKPFLPNFGNRILKREIGILLRIKNGQGKHLIHQLIDYFRNQVNRLALADTKTYSISQLARSKLPVYVPNTRAKFDQAVELQSKITELSKKVNKVMNQDVFDYLQNPVRNMHLRPEVKRANFKFFTESHLEHPEVEGYIFKGWHSPLWLSRDLGVFWGNNKKEHFLRPAMAQIMERVIEKEKLDIHIPKKELVLWDKAPHDSPIGDRCLVVVEKVDILSQEEFFQRLKLFSSGRQKKLAKELCRLIVTV